MFVLLAAIFLVTLIKVFLIFIYFCVISVILNIYRNFCFLKNNKVCNDPRRLCTEIYRYYANIFRKLYTYNYYSLNKSDYLIGGILNFIFFIFICSNIIYLIWDYYRDQIEIDNIYIIIYLLSFETHLFLEILCPLYYTGLTLKESSIQATYFFLYSNCSSIFMFKKVVGLVIISLNLHNDNITHIYDYYFMKFSHIIYVIIAIYLYAHSFKIIYNTDLNGT